MANACSSGRPRIRIRIATVLVAVGLGGCGPVGAIPLGGQAEAAAFGGAAPAYPAVAGPPIAVGDDRVTVLPRGTVAFPVIHDLIAGAAQRVDVEMYELARPELVAALIDARRRGIAVTVVVDPTVVATAVTSMRLRAAGVDVVDYPVRKQMIDHVKLLVVDSDVAVVGGINWNVTSARHHDFDALVRGPAAVNLERVLLRDLVTCGRAVTIPDALPDPAILIAATLPSSDIRPLAVQLIEEARSSLDLELYVLTDAGIVHALERASRRGVRVRVLLDRTQRPSDASAADLRAAAVPVRLYRGRGELLHAKVSVADARRVLFGSANWTISGFEHNHELDVEILDSTGVAAGFRAAMEADWARATESGPP